MNTDDNFDVVYEFAKHVDLQEPPDGLNYWAEHPKFPLKDWQYSVANNDTRVGYWEWVNRGLGYE